MQKLGFDVVQGVAPVQDYESSSIVSRKWKELSTSLDTIEVEASHLDSSKKYGAVMTTRVQGERRNKIEHLYNLVIHAFIAHVTKYMEPEFVKLVMKCDNMDELYKFENKHSIITIAREEKKTFNDLRAIAEYKQALDKDKCSLVDKVWYRKFEIGDSLFLGLYLGCDTVITDTSGKEIPLKKLVSKRFNASTHIGFPTFNMTIGKDNVPNKIQMRTLVYTMLVKSAISMSIKFDQMH